MPVPNDQGPREVAKQGDDRRRRVVQVVEGHHIGAIDEELLESSAHRVKKAVPQVAGEAPLALGEGGDGLLELRRHPRAELAADVLRHAEQRAESALAGGHLGGVDRDTEATRLLQAQAEQARAPDALRAFEQQHAALAAGEGGDRVLHQLPLKSPADEGRLPVPLIGGEPVRGRLIGALKQQQHVMG